jgi:hypothetical protein
VLLHSYLSLLFVSLNRGPLATVHLLRRQTDITSSSSFVARKCFVNLRESHAEITLQRLPPRCGVHERWWPVQAMTSCSTRFLFRQFDIRIEKFDEIPKRTKIFVTTLAEEFQFSLFGFSSGFCLNTARRTNGRRAPTEWAVRQTEKFTPRSAEALEDCERKIVGHVSNRCAHVKSAHRSNEHLHKMYRYWRVGVFLIL